MSEDPLLTLGRIPRPPDDILQPPRHDIYQVLQVHLPKVSFPLVSTVLKL
jgi:hypothetical protein